jgi:hypothetical protein
MFSIEAGDLEAAPLVAAQARVLEAPVGQSGLPAMWPQPQTVEKARPI